MITFTNRTTSPILMTSDAAILKLAQWLSPAFPVGAFSHSHGLEWAVEAGDLPDAARVEAWLRDVLVHGAGRSDAIFLAASYRAADRAALRALDAQARAFAPSAERLLESVAQGRAFCRVLGAVWPDGAEPDLTYPVALGHAAKLHDLPLLLTARMYLHAVTSNLVSAAIRLVPLGQTEGQRVLTALTPLCATLAAEAVEEDIADIASTAFRSDIAAMKHETQYSRLFRT